MQGNSLLFGRPKRSIRGLKTLQEKVGGKKEWILAKYYQYASTIWHGGFTKDKLPRYT